MKVEINTPMVANRAIGIRCFFNPSILVCRAPAKSKKLSIISSKAVSKSMESIIKLASSKMKGLKLPAIVMTSVKQMAMIIKPMVNGSFRNFVLIKAKAAERTVRMVITVNMLIDLVCVLSVMAK